MHEAIKKKCMQFLMHFFHVAKKHCAKCLKEFYGKSEAQQRVVDYLRGTLSVRTA